LAHADRLEAALEQQRRRVVAGDRLGVHDVEFHQLIAAIAGNGTILTVVDTLRSLLEELRARHLTGDQPRLGLQQHERIAEAIASGDPAGAATAMSEHLDAVEASVVMLESAGA
jgi:GntR family transcriptional repressor for pyruvate dehydrogenase complex